MALLSATGSTRMGRAVGPRVAERFGRSLLELGGNNAAVVAPSADLDLTTRGIVFSAAGRSLLGFSDSESIHRIGTIE